MVRGTEHPHTGDVGKMVLVLEDVRSGGGDRTDPCERVRHTNIIKMKQMQILSAVRVTADVSLVSGSTLSHRKKSNVSC